MGPAVTKRVSSSKFDAESLAKLKMLPQARIVEERVKEEIEKLKAKVEECDQYLKKPRSSEAILKTMEVRGKAIQKLEKGQKELVRLSGNIERVEKMVSNQISVAIVAVFMTQPTSSPAISQVTDPSLDFQL